MWERACANHAQLEPIVIVTVMSSSDSATAAAELGSRLAHHELGGRGPEVVLMLHATGFLAQMFAPMVSCRMGRWAGRESAVTWQQTCGRDQVQGSTAASQLSLLPSLHEKGAGEGRGRKKHGCGGCNALIKGNWALETGAPVLCAFTEH